MASDFQCQSSENEDENNEELSERGSTKFPPNLPGSETRRSPLNDIENLLESGTPSEDNTIPSRASSNKTFTLAPFGFESKTSFDAFGNLKQTRSQSFRIRPQPIDNDIWKRPPPDFRPQVYAPNPPKRNTREAVQPWNYKALCDQTPYIKNDKRVFLPHILKLGPEQEREIPFETRFHIMDPFEARSDFVTNGMYPAGRYSMPKPHDHRGLQPIQMFGLPEFTTASDADPFNLRFQSRNLRTIHGLNTAPPLNRGGGIQMAPPLHLPPKWETRLILQKDSWPQRSCGYTRYRSRSRTAHSALMERIDDKLTARWAKEKLESAIKSQCHS